VQRNFRRKYTYKGIVYITEYTGEEVTSYAIPVTLQTVPISRELQEINDQALITISSDKSVWKSNTVIVVDTSGSMRSCDVFDTKTRLDAVWLSIALDYVAERLESGGGNEYDVISIVSMGPRANIIIKEHPTTWVLYNRIVNFYNHKIIQPYSHGNYIPSIDMAEKLLYENPIASCALGLCFISDGKPSDHITLQNNTEDVKNIVTDRVASLAKKFGRRLQFDAVGIGSADDFNLLEAMVEAAADYGAKASFSLPSLSSSAMGNVLKSFATSMTSTQTEMTCISTKKQLAVKDVIRESRQKARERIICVYPSDYFIYQASNVQRFSWTSHRDSNGKWRGSFEPICLQDENASFVAFHKCVFGEGGERLVHRFYELDQDGKSIVGGAFVAKESRFVATSEENENHGNEKEREKFVKIFCNTQQLAARIAEEFNEKLYWLRRVDDATPRVHFLECSVYKMKDNRWGDLSVLVEPRLDEEKWYKWNSNNGYVDGMKEVPKFDAHELKDLVFKLENLELDAIGEENEEEEEEEENEGEEETEVNDNVTKVATGFDPIVFTPFQVAQAFSCFSFWATGRKRLICDLQGVFDEKENVLKLSDPVIHYCDRNKTGKRMVHGRTDRGSKGVAMFQKTHECNHLCRLVTGSFKRKWRRDKENKHNEENAALCSVTTSNV
jgi:hypothetical protein